MNHDELTPATVAPQIVARKGYVLQPGSILGNHRVEKGLGSGGMGEVYLAVNIHLNARRAIKILKPEVAAANPVFAERFIQEARLATQLQHQNIVNVLDVSYSREFNIRYIVMEYVDGGNIRNMLKMFGAINERKALEMVLSLCDVLQKAENLNMVHRDIKPENIMLTRSGQVKLADFGIAKSMDARDSQLTMISSLIGTPAYIAPEQARDAHAVDGRADIYSLGVVLYEMLTGAKCFTGRTAAEILEKVFCNIEHNPQQVNCNISLPAAALVMRMMARDPGRRPQNAAALRTEISAILDDFRERRTMLRNVISDRLYAQITAIPYTIKRLLVLYCTSRTLLRVHIFVLAAMLWLVLSLNGCVKIDYAGLLSVFGAGRPVKYQPLAPLSESGYAEIKVTASNDVIAYLRQRNYLLEVNDGSSVRQVKWPCLYELPVGTRQLVLRINDCREIRPVTVEIGRDVTQTLEILPELLPGKLEISADFANPEVLTPDGWLGSETVEVPGGVKNELFVRAPGCAVKKIAALELAPGERKVIAVALEPGYREVLDDASIRQAVTAFRQADYPQAFQQLSALPANQQRDPEVDYCLGWMYENGKGPLFSDLDKAMEHYRRAAAGRHPGAMKKLGDLYYSGTKSVARDYAAARQWYEAGALLNNPQCMYAVAVMYEFGRGTAVNLRVALAYYLMAALEDTPEAMLALGRHCELGGGGVRPDLEKATFWYQKSARLGNQEAENRLRQIQKK